MLNTVTGKVNRINRGAHKGIEQANDQRSQHGGAEVPNRNANVPLREHNQGAGQQQPADDQFHATSIAQSLGGCRLAALQSIIMVAIEKWPALLIALLCLGMLLRMVMGPVRRARLDAWWRRLVARVRPAKRSSPVRPDLAAQQAREAIERAQRMSRVQREGNVLTPDAFKGPRKPH